MADLMSHFGTIFLARFGCVIQFWPSNEEKQAGRVSGERNHH